MNAAEFLRKIPRLGRERGVRVTIDFKRGKGSHAIVFYGSRSTVLKDRRKELGHGLLGAMLSQLGLSKSDLV